MAAPKVAFVTGASRGIGFEIARHLVEKGWKVGMTARNSGKLQQAAAELGEANTIAIGCDVSDRLSVEAACKQVAERFGTISALVNNAAVIDPVGRVLDSDPDEWVRLLEINICGVVIATRTVLPGMLELGSGVIVNLSSGAARNVVEGWSAYCSSKAGMSMFTHCVHAEYGHLGIRAYNFIPGLVGTDMLNDAQAKFDNAVARVDDSQKLTPDLPARCIAWLVEEADGQVEGVEQSIRDPDLRRKVGLEERSRW